MGQDVIILLFLMLSGKPAFHSPFSPSSRGSFSFSSLTAIRMVSSAYLRFLLFLPEFVIPTCDSPNLAFHMIYSALWRWQWHPIPVLFPGKSHGQRSLVGCSPWGRWELDTTERLHFHFSLSCIGEGNGNSLQCSCLENPRDGGARWAAVCGVAQGRTRLKRLSSSRV